MPLLAVPRAVSSEELAVSSSLCWDSLGFQNPCSLLYKKKKKKKEALGVGAHVTYKHPGSNEEKRC